MADFYCDQGGYPTWVEPPAWGTAYDGDGEASGLATVATATIDCTGVTAAATNTVTIAGVVLTCVASGATAGQFNAGSGATLATNLVASINAATGVVSASVSYSQPQLRDLCFARVNPGNSSQVQIMTRAGSTLFNHAANSAVAIATAGLTGTPTITQFAGGASGAWSTVLVNQTVLPSAIAVGSYTCAAVNIAANRCVLAVRAQLTVNDTTWVRARNQDIQVTNVGITLAGPYSFLVDASNVKWGDTLGKTFMIGTTTSSANNGFNFSINPGTAVTTSVVRLAATVRGALIIRHQGTRGGLDASGTNVTGAAIHHVLVENVLYWQAGGAVHQVRIARNFTASTTMIRHRNCDFRFTPSAQSAGIITHNGAPTSVSFWDFEGCGFLFDSFSGTLANLVSAPPANVYCDMSFKNCFCQSAGTVYFGSTINTGFFSLRVLNCTGFGVNTIGRFGSQPVGVAGQTVIQHSPNKKATIVESFASLVAWIPDVGFPTFRAFMQDGTYWSWRATWSNSASMFAAGGAVDQIALSKQTPAGDAVRTVTMEILLPPDAASVSNKDLAMTVGYTGGDNVVRSETTQAALDWLEPEVALATSTAAWDLGAYPSYIKRKLTLTTAATVKGASDLTVTLQFLRAAPVANVFVFIDPEIEVV